LALAGWSTVLACEDVGACEEDVRAQVIDDRVVLSIGDGDRRIRIEAELADETAERERGWRYRRCDREGLWLVPDVPGELAVWGCGLTAPIDVAFVADGEIIDVFDGLEPCGEDGGACGDCSLVGEGLVVDGVLEVPEGTAEFVVGDAVVELE